MRCPFCHAAVVVPAQSRSESQEGYIVAEGVDQPPLRRGISFTCRVCRTRLTVGEEEAGREVVCPDCGVRLTVPPPDAKAKKRTPPSPGEYALRADDDLTHADAHVEAAIPLFCGLCGTLMRTAASEVGTKLICPDCGAATVVPPLKPPPPKRPFPGEYAVRAEDEAARTDPRRLPMILFFCGVCHTLMHAEESEAGAKRICPDCGSATVVPPPKPPRRIALATGEGPRVRNEPSPPRPEPPWRLLRHSRVYAVEADAGQSPPRWPLLQGVFAFPFRGDALEHWMRLTLGGTIAFFFGGIAASTLEGIAALVGIFFFLAAIFFALAWLGLVFACGLAILCDTAAGSDRVYEWPDPWMFLDWLGDVFFVVNSVAIVLAAVAVLPGCWFGAAVRSPRRCGAGRRRRWDCFPSFSYRCSNRARRPCRSRRWSSAAWGDTGWRGRPFTPRARPWLSSPSRRLPASG